MSQFSGTKRIRPLSTAAMAGAAKRCDPHVPLVGQVGLDDRAAAIAARHHELVRLDALDESSGRAKLDDAPARLESVQALQMRGRRFIQARVGREAC